MNVDLGSDTVAYVSWKAQDKTWCIDGVNCELKKFLVDPKSIKIGQGKLAAGIAPEWVWNTIPTETVKLQDGFKKAFQVQIYVSEKHGSPVSEVRDWSSNQRASREAIMKLFKSLEEQPGKWARVSFEGAEPQKFGEATVNVPILKLEGWSPAPKVEEKNETAQNDVEFE